MLIYLVDPVHTYTGTQNNAFIPLSVLNISSYIQEQFGSEIEVRVFKFPERILAAIKNRPPDMIGVSNYSWNFHLGLAILTSAKKANPDVVTVMGGPNVTLTEPEMRTLLADGLIDYYVPDNDAGGEKSFSSLVAAKLSNAQPLHEHEKASGLWYLDKRTSCAQHIPSCPSEKSMDWLPSPFLKGLADEFFEDGLTAMIETNRGSPFHCTFSVWGCQDNYSKVAQFSVESVQADLDYIVKQVHQDLLLINDANFGLFNDRDLKIARHIKKLKQERNWPTSIVVNWGQVRSGSAIAIAEELKGVAVLRQASQSQDEQVLKTIKRDIVPKTEWNYLAKECRRKGIESFAEMIVMLPNETLETYLNGLRYFFDLGVNCIVTNQCQLLKGSEMNTQEHRDKYEMKTAWRLLENAYGIYDDFVCLEAEEIVVETNTFSFEENILCRKLNWLIQMSWTLRRHHLILKLLKENQVNPVDFLLYVINHIDQGPGKILELFKSFDKEARGELFPTYANLVEHYNTDDKIKNLQGGEFAKLNTSFSGKALALNSQIILFYCEMAKQMLSEKDCYSEQVDETLKAVKLFTEEISVSTMTLEEIKNGVPVTDKSLALMCDIAKWENDVDQRPFTNFYVKKPYSYRFFIELDQNDAIKQFLERVSDKDRNYQLQKLCEPFFGIPKKHLNYSYQIV